MRSAIVYHIRMRYHIGGRLRLQHVLPLWSIFMNENGVRHFDVNHALISHTYAISSDIALPVFLRIVTICSKIHSSSGNVTYVKF